MGSAQSAPPASAVEGFVTPPSSPSVSFAAGDAAVDPAPGRGYHPLSGLPTAGYLGNLTQAQERALLELRARMHALGLSAQLAAAVCAPAEDEDGLLLRFLRARGFEVPKAEQMLAADLEWRAELKVAELATRPEAEVLGCDPAMFAHYLPGWYNSEDVRGRVAFWQKWGDLHVDELLKATSLQALRNHHVWQQERQMRRMAERAGEQGVWLSQCVNVIDANHWRPSLATRGALAFLREISTLDQAHYPERMGLIVVINAPYTLSACWALISAWIHPVSREKVRILSGEAYWRPLLASLFELDQIPPEYGGTADVRLRDIAAGKAYVPAAAS